MSSSLTYRARRGLERGITLIEIMVVLVIIGLVLALGTMGVRQLNRTELKENTVQMMAMLRAANNMALMTRQPHRLVIDFEERTFRIERCEGDIKLHRSDRERTGEEDEDPFPDGIDIPDSMVQAMSPDDAAKIRSALTGEASRNVPCVVPTFPNGDTDGRGNLRTLSKGLSFKGVWVQHLEDKQYEGIVAINFFPLGYAEKAVIVLGDEEGNDYSLIVRGLTSTVELRVGEVDADRYMRRNAAGESVPQR